MRQALPLLVALLITGCSSPQKHIGLTKQQLIEIRGVPDRTVKIDEHLEAWDYGRPGTTYLLRDGLVVQRKKRWGMTVTVNDDRDRR